MSQFIENLPDTSSVNAFVFRETQLAVTVNTPEAVTIRQLSPTGFQLELGDEQTPVPIDWAGADISAVDLKFDHGAVLNFVGLDNAAFSLPKMPFKLSFSKYDDTISGSIDSTVAVFDDAGTLLFSNFRAQNFKLSTQGNTRLRGELHSDAPTEFTLVENDQVEDSFKLTAPNITISLFNEVEWRGAAKATGKIELSKSGNGTVSGILDATNVKISVLDQAVWTGQAKGSNYVEITSLDSAKAEGTIEAPDYWVNALGTHGWAGSPTKLNFWNNLHQMWIRNPIARFAIENF